MPRGVPGPPSSGSSSSSRSPLGPLSTTAMRLCAYAWAAPTTLLGLAVVAATGARCRVHAGVLEADGPGVARAFDRLPVRRGIVAMTLGHVVLGRDRASIDDTRAHERVHVAQCERWGIAFVPAYLAASAMVSLRGGDPYLDNPFERAAYGAGSRPPMDEGAAAVGRIGSRIA
jgi:hypothetical protein